MTILMNKIKKYLIENFPENNSGGYVGLSVGESILLVLNSCEKKDIDETILVQLK